MKNRETLNFIGSRTTRLGWVLISFLFMSLISSEIKAQATQLTIQKTNVTVEQVLSLIEKNGQVAFFYVDKDVDLSRKISLNLKNQPIDKILDELFKNTQNTYKIEGKQIYITKKANPAKVEIKQTNTNRKVTGRVLDEQTGEPVLGASVWAGESEQGTITDIDGNFALNISSMVKEISISYLGYDKKDIVLGNQSNFRVSLTPSLFSLDELVVVGYGTQRKGTLTGSIDAISGEKLQNRSSGSVTDLIKGASPNLNITSSGLRGGEPGASGSWNIRGIGSINASASPLILVDGVEMNINNIDPESIESFSVLKDASTSAIYGSRAPFGVILITTKKGKKDGKVNIQYSNNLSMNSPLYVNGFVDALTWTTAYNQANANAGLAPIYSEEQIGRITNYMNGTYPHEYDPANPISSIFGGRRDGNANYDWPHILIADHSYNQKHNINLSGGSQRTQYYVSGGFNDQNGIYAYGYDNYKRFNLLSNLNAKITDWLNFRTSVKYAKGLADYPIGMTTASREYTFTAVYNFAPMTPMYNENGTIQNPIIRLLESSGRSKSEINDLFITVGADFEPVKGWITSVSYNHNNINSFSSSNPKPVLVELGTGEFGNIGKPETSYSAGYNKTNYTLFNVVSNYEKKIGQHYFKALAGYEQEERMAQSLSATASGLISEDIPSISTALGAVTVDDALNHWATQGIFGRINYNYMEKYLLEVSARYNASSRFAPDNRWGFFPSASVGYFVSKENFWNPIAPIINSFKMRASYGSLGNQNVGMYSYIATMGIVNELGWIIDGTRPQYTNAPGLIRDDLTWETVSTSNIGVDAGFFKNRLQANFDWYHRYTSDMLGPAETLPYPLGVGTPLANNAELSTKGFEFVLSWQDRVSSDFSYNVKFTLGDSRSKVMKYKNDKGLIDTWYEGKEIGEIWGYTTDGIIQVVDEPMSDQSKFYPTWGPGDIKYLDIDGNDTINDGTRTLDNHGDLKIIGNTSPRFNYGISAGVDWKGFDFNMFWQGIGQRDYFANRYLTGFWGLTHLWGVSGVLKGSPTLDYWRPEDETNSLGPNTDAYLPKPYFSGETSKNKQVQSRYILNVAFLRLQNMQLGYTLPAKMTKKLYVEKARIYMSGENLLTLTRFPKTLDPDATLQTDEDVIEPGKSKTGISAGVIYPISQVFSVGINIIF